VADAPASPTGELVTLDEVKTHLRLGSADREDTYLRILIAAAVRAVENATGRDIVAAAPSMAERDRAVAAQAVLLLVGLWHANREATGQNMTELPLAITWLIAPLRKFVV
jgi:hypothetical protein